MVGRIYTRFADKDGKLKNFKIINALQAGYRILPYSKAKGLPFEE